MILGVAALSVSTSVVLMVMAYLNRTKEHPGLPSLNPKKWKWFPQSDPGACYTPRGRKLIAAAKVLLVIGIALSYLAPLWKSLLK